MKLLVNLKDNSSCLNTNKLRVKIIENLKMETIRPYAILNWRRGISALNFNHNNRGQ